LKAEDGAKRAAECALLAVLHRFDALSAAELQELRDYANPNVLNTRDEVVGSISAQLVI
jgi:L-asparaginase II